MYSQIRNTSLASVIACALVASLGEARASAQTLEGPGIRASGMGGAFVGVADDATAAYWNPAGFKTGALFSVVIERQGFEIVPADASAGATNRSAAFVGLGAWPFGVAYYRLRHSAVGAAAASGARTVSSLITHNTTVTALHSLTDRITVGTAARFVRGVVADATRLAAPGTSRDTQLDQAADLVGRAHNTFDLDVGVMAEIPRGRVGLVVRNLREPKFASSSGAELELSRQVRAGVAFMPDRALTLAVDADLTRTATVLGDRRNIAVGAERWAWANRLGIRAGARFSTLDAARPVGTAGMSVAAIAGIFLEGQITYGHSDGDRGWGLGMRVAF